MFRLIAAVAAGLLLQTTSILSQEDMGKARKLVFESTVHKPIRVQYLLFLPDGYEASETKRWPLMLFLHGAGERGTNLALVAVHGPPKIVKTKPDFPFILVSPQCPAGQRWDQDVLIALLDEIIAKYRVDLTRVCLTGLSMGGYGTWELGLAYPERFAAIAPICGGGDHISVLLPGPRQAKALKTLGVWAFHGAKDEVVPLAESERMIQAIRRTGNPAKLTVYPAAGHDSWTETYNNPELYEWLLEHQRLPEPVKESKARKSRTGRIGS